jgi:hypothetical protein
MFSNNKSMVSWCCVTCVLGRDIDIAATKAQSITISSKALNGFFILVLVEADKEVKKLIETGR